MADTSYGPGADYQIDSSHAFNVTAKFYAPVNEEGFGDVSRIEINLDQWGNSVQLIHDDPTLLARLSDKLKHDMALVISNFNDGSRSDTTNGQCRSTDICGAHSTKYFNFAWTSMDAIDEGDSLIIGDVAESLTDCDDPFCTSCHEAWYSSDPSDTFFQCMDYRVFKYTNQCGKKRKPNLCGPEDLCFWSFPPEDPKKWKSEEAACRPLPESLIEGDFKYGKNTCNSRRGLCKLGCGEGETCHNSWPIDDPLKWKSPHKMCRCKPAPAP